MTLSDYKTYFEANVIQNPTWDNLGNVMSRFFEKPVEPNVEFTDAIIEADVPTDFKKVAMSYVIGYFIIQPFLLSPKAFDWVCDNCDEQIHYIKERFEADQRQWQIAINDTPAKQHMWFNHMRLTDPQIGIDNFSHYLLDLATPEQRVFAKMKWGMFQIND